jgi:hypothetical protein
MQGRRQWFREISQQVVPGLGDVGLCQVKTCLHVQSRLSFQPLNAQKLPAAWNEVT